MNYSFLKEFAEWVVGTDALTPIVDWISVNMTPEEVFDDNALAYWARHNGFVEDEEE